QPTWEEVPACDVHASSMRGSLSGESTCLTSRPRRVRSSRPVPRARSPTAGGTRFKPWSVVVRIHPCAPLAAAGGDMTMGHDGLVTLDSLIRSPHCVRFADGPLRPERDATWV